MQQRMLFMVKRGSVNDIQVRLEPRPDNDNQVEVPTDILITSVAPRQERAIGVGRGLMSKAASSERLGALCRNVVSTRIIAMLLLAFAFVAGITAASRPRSQVTADLVLTATLQPRGKAAMFESQALYDMWAPHVSTIEQDAEVVEAWWQWVLALVCGFLIRLYVPLMLGIIFIPAAAVGVEVATGTVSGFFAKETQVSLPLAVEFAVVGTIASVLLVALKDGDVTSWPFIAVVAVFTIFFVVNLKWLPKIPK